MTKNNVNKLKIEFRVYSRFLLCFFMFGQFACKPPLPGNEAIRVPTLLTDGQYGKEGVGLSLSLVASLPDPEFKTDKLNPDRYKPGDLTFACIGSCPEGLVIDQVSGNVSWTPSFDQAGVHFVTFSASSGIFSSQKTIPFIIVDVDRATDIPGEPVIISAKEGAALDFKFTLQDPDGDPIEYFCVSGCPAGLSIEKESGLVRWTPDYFQAGTKAVQVKAVSRPKERQISVRGLAPGPESEKVRLEVEKETIDRLAEKAVIFSAKIEVENVDRAPEIFPVANQTIRESEKLSLFLKVLDPDGDEIKFICTDSCPEGLIVDGRTGELLWVPSYEQEGKYAIDVEVVSLEKVQGHILFQIDVKNKNREPFFLAELAPREVKEGKLLLFNLPGSDPDREDSLFYKCVEGCPSGLLVAATGMVAWIPNFDQSGYYFPKFTLSDGKASASIVVPIKVEHVNRSPYFVATPSSLGIPAALASRYNLQGRDDDVEDIGKLRFACIAACPLGLTIDSYAGQINWTPTYDQVGDYLVGFSITDGALTSVANILLSVTRTDRAPRFTSSLSIQGEELKSLSFSVQALDADGDSVKYECSRYCPEGMILNTDTGEVNWLPSAQQGGSYAVVFRAYSHPVWDNAAIKYTETIVNIYIKNFNRAPMIENVSDVEVFEGGHLTVNPESEVGHGIKFLLQASDPDLDTLSYLCIANCPTGLTVNPVTGEVNWTPAYNQAKASNAAYSGIEFAVTDGEFLVRTIPMKITVKDVNRPAEIKALANKEVFENGHQTSSEFSSLGAPLSFKIEASDLDGDQLSYFCHDGCPLGLTVNQASGDVKWTPGYDQAKGGPLNEPYEGIVFRVFDGKSQSFSQPIKITVKNVNRSPHIEAMATSFSVFENGHQDKSELSPDSKPLSIDIAANDPDGDGISFKCSSGCPKGLTVDESLGKIFWKPSYCNAWETGCFPQDTGNSGAKKGNLPYGPIIFEVSDGYSQTFTLPIFITVYNVDRAPVIADVPAVEVKENEYSNFTINAYDPDGDTLSFKCEEVLVSSTNISDFCRKSGSNYYYPALTGPENYGHSQFFSLSTQTGKVNIGTPSAPVGYYDAQKFNAPYIFKYQVSSLAINFPETEKRVFKSQEVKIVNVDRGTAMAEVPAKVVSEPDDIQFSLAVGLAVDPDAEWEEFKDSVEYYCDPSGPDGCPRGLKIKQNCKLTCDYGVNPLGCPAGSKADVQDKTCTNKGLVFFDTDYGHAKKNGAPYIIRLLSRSSVDSDDFSLAEYPPIDIKLDVQIQVLNTDRPPEMRSSPITISVREPCGHKPVGYLPMPDEVCGFGDINSPKETHANEKPYGELKEATFSLSAFDPDSEIAPGQEETEERPHYTLLGCQSPSSTIAGSLSSCPTWITLNEDGLVSIKPNSYKDALPDNAPRYIVFQTSGCPLSETGWSCSGPQSKSIQKVTLVVTNEDRAPDPVTISPAIPYVKDPNSELNLTEIEDYSFKVSSLDPDGDEVVFCIKGDTRNITSQSFSTLYSLNTVLGDSPDGKTALSTVTMNSYANIYGRNQVSRLNSGEKTQKFEIRACSSSRAAPSCEDISRQEYLRCSEPLGTPNLWDGWKTISARFYDVDRPPELTSAIGDTGMSEVDTLMMRFTYTDPDVDDLVKICQRELPRELKDTSGSSENPLLRVNNENCTGVIGGTGVMSYSTNNNYATTTRAQNSRTFLASYEVCYANGPSPYPVIPVGMPSPPNINSCYSVKNSSMTVTNKDRPPTFTPLDFPKLVFSDGRENIKQWNNFCNLNPNDDRCQPDPLGLIDWRIFYDSMWRFYPIGGTKSYVAEYDGGIELAFSVTDKDFDQDLEVRFCDNSGDRLENIGGSIKYKGVLTNTSAKWDIDFDFLRGTGRLYEVKPTICLKVCYSGESCPDGPDNSGSINLTIKDSDRLPQLYSGTRDFSGDGFGTNPCDHPAEAVKEYLMGTPVSFDQDGDPVDSIDLIHLNYVQDEDWKGTITSCRVEWNYTPKSRGGAGEKGFFVSHGSR